MEAGLAPRAALSLISLALILGPIAGKTLQAQTRPAPYPPKPQRLEILKSWEKAARAPPRELVAGIYELDWQGSDFENKLALTIDDCLPNKVMAEELDILKARGIKAVFFIIGSNFLDKKGAPMPRAKELLDRLVSEGHAIGSHSYRHRRMDQGAYRDDRKAIVAELNRNEAAIDKVLTYHYPILYFRPPNGAHSTPLYVLDRALRERGQYLANWTITSFDWCIRLKAGNPDRLTPDKVIARTLKQAREDSGGVILVHGFPETAAILGSMLDALASAENKRGKLTFSTLEEIMRLKYE
jgi:peptidoglycan/xylan/chitin deacetylase (PgdA/CDA1 family)